MRRTAVLLTLALLGLLAMAANASAELAAPSALGCLGPAPTATTPESCGHLLAPWAGGDEHPQAAVPSPDGRSLFVVLGSQFVRTPGGGFDDGPNGILRYAVAPDGTTTLVACLLTSARPGCDALPSSVGVFGPAATLAPDGGSLLLGTTSGVVTVSVADAGLRLMACTTLGRSACGTPPTSNDDPDEVVGFPRLAVAPDGRDVYVLTGSSVHDLRRDAAGGLTARGCLAGGCLPVGATEGDASVLVTPDGDHVVVVSGDVISFTRLADGRLRRRGCLGLGEFDDGCAPLPLGVGTLGQLGPSAMGPDGTFVATDSTRGGSGDGIAHGLGRFRIAADGAPELVGCTAPAGLGCDPTPARLQYLLGSSGPNVTGMAITSRGRLVTSGDLTGLWDLADDGAPSYAGCLGQQATCAPNSPVGGGSGAVAAAADGRTAWVADGRHVTRLGLDPRPDSGPAPEVVEVDSGQDPNGGFAFHAIVDGHGQDTTLWFEVERPDGSTSLIDAGSGTGRFEVHRSSYEPTGPRYLVKAFVRSLGGTANSVPIPLQVPATSEPPIGPSVSPIFYATRTRGGAATLLTTVATNQPTTRVRVRYGPTAALGREITLSTSRTIDLHRAPVLAVPLEDLPPGDCYVEVVADDDGGTSSRTWAFGVSAATVPRLQTGVTTDAVVTGPGGSATVVATATAGSVPATVRADVRSLDDPYGTQPPPVTLGEVEPGDGTVTVRGTLRGLRPGGRYVVSAVAGSWPQGTSGQQLTFVAASAPATTTPPTTPTTPSTTTPPAATTPVVTTTSTTTTTTPEASPEPAPTTPSVPAAPPTPTPTPAPAPTAPARRIAPRLTATHLQLRGGRLVLATTVRGAPRAVAHLTLRAGRTTLLRRDVRLGVSGRVAVRATLSAAAARRLRASSAPLHLGVHVGSLRVSRRVARP